MNLPVLVALQMESHNSSLVSDFFNKKNVFKVDSYCGTYHHLTPSLPHAIICIDCPLFIHFPVAAVHSFNCVFLG